MNMQEVIDRVDSIRRTGEGDDEAAHSMEDKLYRDFIAHVTKRKGKLGQMAKVVLSTQDFDFCRWTA